MYQIELLEEKLFLAKRGRRPRVAGFIILSLKGLRRDEISCGVSVIYIYFLAKRGRRPRVAGFIILSLKGLRRDEISCGVYGHVYIFIYFFICEVGVCRKWRHTAVRSWPNGVRRRKTQIWGPGVRILQGVFFFLLFLFFFFVSNPEPFLEPFLFFVFLFGLK